MTDHISQNLMMYVHATRCVSEAALMQAAVPRRPPSQLSPIYNVCPPGLKARLSAYIFITVDIVIQQ
jgi:hypothetical protein